MVQINKSLNSFFRWPLLSVALVFLSACTEFVTLTQDDITGRPSDTDLNFYIHKSKRILACVQHAGGICPADDSGKTPDTPDMQASIIASAPAYKVEKIDDVLKTNPITKESIQKGMSTGTDTLLATFVSPAQVKAANLAFAAITNPTAAKLEQLYKEATGIKGPQLDQPLTISKKDVGEFAKSIQEATNFNGWTSARLHLQGVLRDKKYSSEKSLEVRAEAIALKSTVEKFKILEAYLAAYFENGEFVSLDIDFKNMEESAREAIKSKFGVSDEVAKMLSVNLLTALIGTKPGEDNKYHILTKKKDGGFVTRGGSKYAFPGLSISIDPLSESTLQIAKIDFTQVGSDVVRVFFEALGDQWGQLPADQTSTACKAIKDNQFDKQEYPNLKCYEEDKETVKAGQFAKVNEFANQVEALAATATGQILRGVSWLSLNNEALAKIIETAVGVVARKATEKVAWCVYACHKNDPKAAFSANDEIRTIHLSVIKR